MNILVLNAGSNSLKFEIIDAEPEGTGAPIRFGRKLVEGAYDDIGKQEAAFRYLDSAGKPERKQMAVRSHGHAAELVIGWIEGGGAREHGVTGLANIERIGCRVVHGADRFTKVTVVTDGVLQEIEALSDLAPLHNESAVAVIRAARTAANSNTPVVAVFDTVFHQTIPEEAALYAIPLEIAKKHSIRRYGFHGTSHRYMMLRYSQIVGRPIEELKLITLHLEGGSSAAAIRGGKSVETSMGFTPLEGLVMGTRCGDIDPAMVTYLMKKEGLDIEGVERFLNKDCGLLGVSQMSGDTRRLVEHLGEKLVELAIEIFAHRVRKYIGAYLAVLGGCDAIIFGGGIGENTPLVRERIASGFGWCGAELDADRNRKTIDFAGEITKAGSRVGMWVVPTQEALMIAHDVANCD